MKIPRCRPAEATLGRFVAYGYKRRLGMAMIKWIRMDASSFTVSGRRVALQHRDVDVGSNLEAQPLVERYGGVIAFP
jgi:hypothetical protein